MFNFYKYSFLFIINLSLAQKIDSCNNLNLPGIYILDKVRINNDYYNHIVIDLREIPKQTHTENNEYGDFIAYTLEGTINYIKNDENYEINILNCTDFISKDKSIRESTVTLSNSFINSKNPLSISILSSNILSIESANNELRRVSDDILPQEELSELNYIDPMISALPDAKKVKLTTHVKDKTMLLASKSTHKSNKIASSMSSQQPQIKNREFTNEEPTDELSGSSEIAPQSSCDEAGTSNQSIVGFNGEFENNSVTEIKNISVLNRDAIQKIIKNLDENQSIILTPDDSFSKRVTYSKIIINYFTTIFKSKSYNITLFHESKGKKTHDDFLICVYTIKKKEKGQVKDKLLIKLSPRNIIKNIDSDSETKESKSIVVIIDNYKLSISTTLQPEAKLDEIKKPEDQLISDLKKQYGENFVTLCDNISGNYLEISSVIQNLKDNEKLIFIQNNQYYKNTEYKKIEITKNPIVYGQFGTNYYNIYIEYKTIPEELIEGRPISVTLLNKNVYLQIKVKSNGKVIKRSFIVTDFHLARVPYTRN